MIIDSNNQTLTIIENGKEIEINYKECQGLCTQYLANAIAEYDNTHDEKFKTKSEEWQNEFSKRVIDKFFNELGKKKKR